MNLTPSVQRFIAATLLATSSAPDHDADVA
jgi:hypothetical protein